MVSGPLKSETIESPKSKTNERIEENKQNNAAT